MLDVDILYRKCKGRRNAGRQEGGKAGRREGRKAERQEGGEGGSAFHVGSIGDTHAALLIPMPIRVSACVIGT
jgi:hypothetical protein